MEKREKRSLVSEKRFESLVFVPRKTRKRGLEGWASVVQDSWRDARRETALRIIASEKKRVVESRSPRDRKRACVEDTRNYTGTPVTMALLYIRNYSPTRDTYISLSMHDVVITFIIRSRSFYHGATIHTHVQIITCRVTDTPAPPPPSSKSSSPLNSFARIEASIEAAFTFRPISNGKASRGENFFSTIGLIFKPP